MQSLRYGAEQVFYRALLASLLFGSWEWALICRAGSVSFRSLIPSIPNLAGLFLLPFILIQLGYYAVRGVYFQMHGLRSFGSQTGPARSVVVTDMLASFLVGVGTFLAVMMADTQLNRLVFVAIVAGLAATLGRWLGVLVSQLLERRLQRLWEGSPALSAGVFMAGLGVVSIPVVILSMYLLGLDTAWISLPSMAGFLSVSFGLLVVCAREAGRSGFGRSSSCCEPGEGRPVRYCSGPRLWRWAKVGAIGVGMLLAVYAVTTPVNRTVWQGLRREFALARKVVALRRTVLGPGGIWAWSKMSALDLATLKDAYEPLLEPGGGTAQPSFARLKRAARPGHNLLVLTLDAVRADKVGLYGYNRDTTPHLDAFGKEAIAFNSAYSCGVRTHQSIPCLFFGRYPSSMLWERPHFHNYLVGEETSLAQLLQARGYQTVGIAYHSHWFNHSHEIQKGFDIWDTSIKRASRTDPTAARVTDKIIDYLEKRDRSAPFYLWAHVIDCHHPWPKDRETSRFGKHKADLYDGVLSKVDREVGRLLGALQDMDLYDNTVVVITSDHGEELLDHGNWHHGWFLYEEAIRIPLIIRVPSLRPKWIKEGVSSVDIMPSMLNVLGVEEGWERIEGWNFAPLLEGTRWHGRAPIISERWDSSRDFRGRKVSMVDQPMKFIVDLDADVVEVFNLEKDPLEKDSLSKELSISEASDKWPEVKGMMWWVANRPPKAVEK